MLKVGIVKHRWVSFALLSLLPCNVFLAICTGNEMKYGINGQMKNGNNLMHHDELVHGLFHKIITYFKSPFTCEVIQCKMQLLLEIILIEKLDLHNYSSIHVHWGKMSSTATKQTATYAWIVIAGPLYRRVNVRSRG